MFYHKSELGCISMYFFFQIVILSIEHISFFLFFIHHLKLVLDQQIEFNFFDIYNLFLKGMKDLTELKIKIEK